MRAPGGRWLADGGGALPACPVLCFLCVASAVTMVVLGSRLTFFNDDWFFLLQRPGFTADSLLSPYNGHLNLVPVVTWKALIALFGFDSQAPFRVALAALNAALAILVFLFVRERAGQLLGLVAAAVLLFLGPGWEALLFFSSISLIGSLAAGVAALLALERDTLGRNLLACALLVVSVLTSNLALAFVVAGVVTVALRRRPSQLWIPGVPGGVFALWWVLYGNEAAETDVTFANLARTPQYVLDSIASGLASLTGLTEAPGGGYDPYAWGRPLLALATIGTFVWLYRGGRPPRYALAVAAAGVTFWALAGADFTPPGDEPTASRYQLVTATLLILFAAELFRPVRLPPPALATISALALVAIGSNLSVLREGYHLLHRQSALARADLGALDIARGRIGADFRLTEPAAGTPFLGGVTAGAYYRERDQHGSPAYSPAQIAAAPPDVRQAADRVLVNGYGLRLVEAPFPARLGSPDCRRLDAGFDTGPLWTVSAPEGARITNVGPTTVTIAMRRFAPAELGSQLGTLGSRFSATLGLPEDRLATPWRLGASGGTVEVCPK